MVSHHPLSSSTLPPSHHISNTNFKHLTKMHPPTPVITANGTVHAQHKYRSALTMKSGALINQYAIQFLGVQDNRLSMADVVESLGPVVVTKTGMYSMPSPLFRIQNLNNKLTTCKGGLYISKATVTQNTPLGQHVLKPNPTGENISSHAHTLPYCPPTHRNLHRHLNRHL